MQSGAQPGTHVGGFPWGVWQTGALSSGPSCSQQICDGSQHCPPQHVEPAPHVVSPPSRSQGVGWHDPLQKGLSGGQATPQPPQLNRSFKV
jgi:hypothetical protein